MATTTGTFSGMNLDKPSSKVLAPPGGSSSISFGDSEPAPPRQQQQARQPTTDVFNQQPQQDYSPAKSAKPQASGNFNLLSGEPQAAAGQNGARGKQQKERMDPANMPAAGSRLEDRQVIRKEPPGGKSSFSFGGN